MNHKDNRDDIFVQHIAVTRNHPQKISEVAVKAKRQRAAL